ncbi:hypothetical protein [Streptomyces sanglieri]|uniref:hypothetical protein n=1 Tax=Streptomyces sanglieri TaxID=193460 RepID=UPI00352695F4
MGWEQLHEDAYGMSAWRRAVVSCGALVAHHAGYDRHGPRPARPDAPDPVTFGRECIPVVELLALAACRAAGENGVLVDDVELPQLLGWVDGAHTDQLPDGPLLDSDRTDADWRRLAEDDQCRRRAAGLAVLGAPSGAGRSHVGSRAPAITTRVIRRLAGKEPRSTASLVEVVTQDGQPYIRLGSA